MTTNDDYPWTAFVRETLAGDPEWARHVESLNPRISLRKAIEEYVHAMKVRAGVTAEDAQTVELVLAAMKRHRFRSVDAFFIAADRGEVSLTDGLADGKLGRALRARRRSRPRKKG